jgi:2'-5' RNA ligase
VRELKDEFPQDPEGLCANLYKEATGRWPGQAKASGETVHTGAMVALMPSEADANRLSKLSSEVEDQLHLTLFYLGEATDWDDDARNELIRHVERIAGWLAPVAAKAFGVSTWNPSSDSPAFVWNIGDDTEVEQVFRLQDVHTEVRFALDDVEDKVPAQHSPWAPHVCAAYGEADIAALTEGCGPVVFDRIRVGFGGEYTDFPLSYSADEVEPAELTVAEEVEPAELTVAEEVDAIPVTAGWSTPGDDALAYENQQTGDGRVFVPDALYWDGTGPWPLMANENFDSHDDASLAGAIDTMNRDSGRLDGRGVLYLSQEAGYEAALLLAQGAPLGVSVDLDDVDVEMVDATGVEAVYRTRMLHASVLPTPDGGYFLRGEMAPVMTASDTATVTETTRIMLTVGPDGTVPRSAFELRAAAGDPDAVDGTVMDRRQSGDYLMRITRARVRGATLVIVPAFAGARITLDDAEMFASDEVPELDEISAAIHVDTTQPYDTDRQAATWADRSNLGNTTDTDYARVLRHVRSSKVPVGPARVAQKLRMPVAAAQRLLALAASRGEVVKLTRGLYTDRTTSAKADHVMHDDQLAGGEDVVASVTGAVDLPVAGRDREWDGPGAETRVFEWADGDTSKLDQAFAYRDDDADPTTKASRKLGYADVVDGRLTIIPRGVFAASAAVSGARGGVDIPSDELGGVKNKLTDVRAHVDEETGGSEMDEMQSSAWAAMADLPAMPAAWFREPTVDELPSGGAGVNYSNGRIFGWVAQANEPHAGYAKRIVINDLGRIDTTHFLRQRFTLDDGSSIKAGAFTMNAGHHRDGAECETSACQFDDTRTVAGIVTVGMNERGMWFSGAAAPWLSEWDRSVFMATQPSYHLKQSPKGGWQLRAVLAVPVPGHSSPLLASAVVERAQLALTAAATMAEVDRAVETETARQAAVDAYEMGTSGDRRTLEEMVASIDYDRLADSMVAAMTRAEERKAAEEAELAELLAEASKLDPDTIEGT